MNKRNNETEKETVKITGAPAHSRLVGINPCNEGLILYVHKAQTKEGGRIVGEFDLEKIGTGYYNDLLGEFMNERKDERFDSAKEFFKEIEATNSKITHILNRNNLKRIL